MSKILTITLESGVVHELVVKDAEFHVYPLLIPEGEDNAGEPHPLANKISSYKIDTSDTSSNLDIAWFKLERIEAIFLSDELTEETT